MRDPAREEAHCFELMGSLDERCGLAFAETSTLPFAIERIYYLYDVPSGKTRGEHGHKALRQCILCLNGSVDIEIEDGFDTTTFTLSSPRTCLYVPAMHWRKLSNFSPSAVVLVLASAPYDAADYIHDHESFVAMARAARSS
jgi:hypothetical protein